MNSENFINKIKGKFCALVILSVLVLSNIISTTAVSGQKQETQNTASDSAAIYNTRGNTCLLQLHNKQKTLDTLKLNTAIMNYQKAIEMDPDDGGIKLNMAIAYMIKGDTTMADSFFASGLAQCDSSLFKVFNLLSMDTESEEKTKGATAYIAEDKIKERVRKAAKKIKPKRKTSKGKGDKTKKKGPETGSGGEKRLDILEAKKFLYWKH